MKKRSFILFFLFMFFLPVSSSFAQENNLSLVAKSRYFSVYAPARLDIEEVLSKLNYNYFLRVENLKDETSQDPESILVKTLDSLYLEASDILGIHVYSFHGNIRLYPDQASLNKAFRNYFHEDFPERSFYFHETNTIYISLPDLTLGMLGHEISHAILSHYFVVPPPPKVQEILCGYVEYDLRKAAGTLP